MGLLNPTWLSKDSGGTTGRLLNPTWITSNDSNKEKMSDEEKLNRRIENYESRFSAVGETPPEPEKESNLLLKALDVLDTPRRELLKGLTGKEHVSELLEGHIENPYLRGAAGFVGDVLMDPLTYLTLGTAGVAKGAGTAAAKQGAKYLKFAGQPIADVTPIADVIGKGVEKTKLPELLGPIFSNKYIRRAVTSEEEMPDIKKALGATRNTQRLIKGQQQEALDRMEGVFKGLSPEAAAQAAHIIEAPTLLRKQGAQAARKTVKPLATNIKKFEELPGAKPMKDSAYTESIEGLVTPTPKKPPILTVPINEAVQVAFEKAPIPPGLKQNVSTLFRQAKNGTVDKQLLTDTLKKLPEKYQRELFDGVRQAITNKRVPSPRVAASIARAGNRMAKVEAQKGITDAELFDIAKKVGIETTPESRAAALVAKKLTEETAAKDIAAGVQFTELPNYIRHLYKDPPEKVQAVLNQWMKERAKLPGKKAGFQKERKIPTIAEAKRLGLTPIEDVRVLTAVRELEGIQQRAINGMYKELEKIGSNVVRNINDAPAGWKSLPGIKQLEGKAVHPEVERFISRFNSTINTDEGVRTMLSVLNGVQNFWKGLVTAPNPMFHVRNAMSNVFNNFLAGVVNPDVYRLAVIAQRGGNEALTIGGKDYTAKELRKVFREKGLEGFGFFHGESPKSMIREASERFGQQPKLSKISPIQKGRKVGDYLETNAKMAHFIDRLNKGYTPEQAAESARKYLFDYGDLTEAEKKIRSLVPFYTFTRKNLPLQLENLITNPGKMSAVFKLSENAKAAQGTQEGDMPEWMKSELAIPLDKKNYLLLDLPVNQLNMIGGGNTMKNFVGMMTPFAKIPVELAMGRQIFSGTPIEKYPGAVSRLGNLELPAGVTYGLSQLGPLPRTAADIAGSIVNQEPKNAGNLLSPAPKQRPAIGTFIRRVDPERERTLALLRREQELADFRRYLEEVKGVEVPTVAELKKSKGRVF